MNNYETYSWEDWEKNEEDFIFVTAVYDDNEYEGCILQVVETGIDTIASIAKYRKYIIEKKVSLQTLLSLVPRVR